MRAAAAAQEFEQAAVERNRLAAVRSLLERQRVANSAVGTLDAVAVALAGADANAQVFQVRDGVLSDPGTKAAVLMLAAIRSGRSENVSVIGLTPSNVSFPVDLSKVMLFAVCTNRKSGMVCDCVARTSGPPRSSSQNQSANSSTLVTHNTIPDPISARPFDRPPWSR